MKVCLFYKKVHGLFWVVDVGLVDGVIVDVQTDDCVMRNPHSIYKARPLDMSEDLARAVARHLEEKSSVDGWSIVRQENEKY